MNYNERTGVRRGTNCVINQTRAEHLVGWQAGSPFPNVVAGGPIHAAATNVEARRIGEDCRLP